MDPKCSTEAEEWLPVELIVGSWPLARKIIGRYIAPGAETWEGTTAAWFAEPAKQAMPFFVIINGPGYLLLYARSISGLFGLPIAIVRINRQLAANVQMAVAA
jgi:hypothetical protein